MRRARRIGLSVAAVVVVAALWLALRPGAVYRALVARFSDDYAPRSQGPLKRSAAPATLSVRLERIAEGIPKPTDLQFSPARPDQALVASKDGQAHWVSLPDGRHGVLFEVEVLTVSEQGLLGLALHPDFAHNGRLFSNQVVARDGDDVSQVVEWKVSRPDDLEHARVSRGRVLMEVEQPYQNHNAGQLAFGPDGMLYVGWGDGGFRDDPGKHGQNPRTFLGSMLRIDVDRPPAEGRGYAIPQDNPFVGREGFAPEVYAYGLRNPWRFSFDPQGRMVIADVGQDTWEEVSLVAPGDNLGWALKEGFVCFVEDPGACARDDLVDPIHVYGRDLGISITGGHVYTGERIPELSGKYVFGDFVTGRLFALDLPARREPVDAIALGKWPLLVSSFGRDLDGELYLTAYGRGEIYRLAPVTPAASDAGPRDGGGS